MSQFSVRSSELADPEAAGGDEQHAFPSVDQVYPTPVRLVFACAFIVHYVRRVAYAVGIDSGPQRRATLLPAEV